jgi:hypothetical protein
LRFRIGQNGSNIVLNGSQNRDDYEKVAGEVEALGVMSKLLW